MEVTRLLCITLFRKTKHSQKNLHQGVKNYASALKNLYQRLGNRVANIIHLAHA